ncbi:uncharacterized protein L969DRAFT_83865 [Mixia osmundae IAM 14324]|nr:uncharacterized protein L969DRAFT_83865 [Mixia osmundae IAM 14324]KEI42011.1 hypothetical protein L969DRAFT_83865 [Mixia osmundae IAM 14324]
MLDMPAMRYDRTLGGTHSSLMIGGRQLTLYEARSFMNVCGPSIAKAVKRFEPDHLIVMHDDLDVAPGMLKYSKAGGTRGHNGLRSLDATLKSPRRELIRLGIGRPSSGSVADYVLSSLGHTEAGDFAYDAVTRQPGAALEQLWQVIQDAMASASAQKEAHAK